MKPIERLYIHIPFCKTKCGYCSFYSLPSPDQTIVDSYISKIEKDIENCSNKLGNLKSIFIGGGTPSLLSEKHLKLLFKAIHLKLQVSDKTEFSIECNPESLTDEKIDIISDNVNRVSLGIQSFSKKNRSLLGRQGSLSNFDKIVTKLNSNGIDNISADFIYGIPGQSIEDWKKDLLKALEYPLKHISAYSLTFEEGTELLRKRKKLITPFKKDLSPDMWEIAENVLAFKKFYRYEISNYALKNYECKHNLEIWFGDLYLGLGPAASSFDGNKRWTNPKLYEWLKNKPPEIDNISYNSRITEILIMGLRCSDGWTIIQNVNSSANLVSNFGQHFQIEQKKWENIFNSLVSLKEERLLSIENTNRDKLEIKPTEKGMLFWNEIGLALI